MNRILKAAAITLLSADLVRLCIGVMVFNVIALALPLSFLVRLCGDRTLLGDRANGRVRTALMWALTGSILVAGLAGMAQFLG